jgi:hypothetical protein
VLDLLSNVLFVLHQDLDFQLVTAHQVLTKMNKESVKIVEYNVKNVSELLISVNHVLKEELLDLNQFANAQMDNTKMVPVSVKTVHSDVVNVLTMPTTVSMNVHMKPEF